MAGRNPLEDPPPHQLVRDFATGPLADRASCLVWCLARQLLDLAELVCRDLRWGAGSRSILQPFFHTQIVQGDGVEFKPTPSP